MQSAERWSLPAAKPLCDGFDGIVTAAWPHVGLWAKTFSQLQLVRQIENVAVNWRF